MIVNHQLFRDLGSLLNKRLTDAGFKTNSNYPTDPLLMIGDSNSNSDQYYQAWNMTYQYFNVSHRIIPAKSRQVYWSKTLLEKYRKGSLMPGQIRAINEISSMSVNGSSLLKFMSSRIENAWTEDAIYSEWKIAHLHLDIVPSPKPHLQTGLVHFVERTGPVLFVHFNDNGLYLIDILSHGKGHGLVWSNKDLIEIVHDNWPDVIASHRIPHVQGSVDSIPSSLEIKQAREAGFSVTLVMNDGTVYLPPGGGLASSGANTQVVVWADSLIAQCRHALKVIEKHADEIARRIQQKKPDIALRSLDLTLTLDSQDRPLFIENNVNLPIYLAESASVPEGSNMIQVVLP